MAYVTVSAEISMTDLDDDDLVREVERQQMAATLRKLEKRRGLVINTAGENIFQLLLEAKIDKLTKARGHFEQQIEVAKAALRLLEPYRFTGEVEQPRSKTVDQSFMDALMESRMGSKYARW